MKRLFTFLAIMCLFNSLTLKAQILTDVVTGLNNPYMLWLQGDTLYFTEESTTDNVNYTITSEAVPSTTEWFTSSPSPRGILFHGDDLYIASNGDYTITRYDMSSGMPVLIDTVVTLPDVDRAVDMVIHGTDMYINSFYSSRIHKIDLTAATPTPSIYLSINSPAGMKLQGDMLYISQLFDGKISRVDLTATTPTAVDVITGMTNPFNMELAAGSLMYISSTAGKVYEADISQTLPVTATEYINSGIAFGIDLVFDGVNTMYVSDITADKILSFNIFPVSTSNINANPDWTIFPNPASDVLNFKGLEEQSMYQIINTMGQIVQEGTVNPREGLTIDRLTTGFYTIRLENGELSKFVKK